MDMLGVDSHDIYAFVIYGMERWADLMDFDMKETAQHSPLDG